MYNELLEKISADAMLITDPFNMRHVSGFKGGEGAVYVSKKRGVLITDSRYTEAAASETDFEIIEEKIGHRRTQILSECMARDGVKRLGFEDMHQTYADFTDYREKLPEVEAWVPAGTAVCDLRRVKTPEEIDCMKKAFVISDEAFRRLCKLVKPGMSELEGAAELEYQFKKLGAAGPSFDTIFAAGKHSSMPHAVPTQYKIQPGDFVTVDFGCILDGYCTDTTRTFMVGEPTDKQAEVYNTVLKAHMSALEALRPGAVNSAIDKIARDIIAEAGYGDCFGHGLGHGVGLEIHEEPRLSPLDDSTLEPGITITVEPGIYLPGQFGVRIEDTAYITEDGYESFVNLPKELMIL